MVCGATLTTSLLASMVIALSWAQSDNPARGKPTGTNGNDSRFPSSGAVDGQLYTTPCAIVFAPVGVPAEWWVDLQESYRVQRLHIYNADGFSGSAARFNNFIVSVGESVSSRTDCGAPYFRDPPLPAKSSVDITCDQVGRLVHIRRVLGTAPPDNIKHIALCEVEVYGIKQYTCSLCPISSTCDGDGGCSQCAAGKKRPECIEDCQNGKYGVDCVENCGQCAGGAPCRKVDGFCSGCETWWTDDRCKTEIKIPVVTSETVSIQTTTNHSATITWVPLHSVPANLAGFYGYKAKHRERGGSYKEGPLIPHNGSTFSYSFQALVHNAVYEFSIDTYRVRGNASTPGDSYSVVPGKTKCNSPNTPKLAAQAENGTETKLGAVVITYTRLDPVDSGCDNISSIVIQYKHVLDENSFTSEDGDLSSSNFTIQPSRSGNYDLRVVVYNNEGLSAASVVHGVTVVNTIPAPTPPPTPSSTEGVTREPPPPSGVNPVIVAVPVVLVVLLAAGVVVGGLFWRRRKAQRTSGMRKANGTDLEKFGFNATAKRKEDSIAYGVENTVADDPQYETASLESMDDIRPATRKPANASPAPKPKPQPKLRPSKEDTRDPVHVDCTPQQAAPRRQPDEPKAPRGPVEDENIYATSAVPVDGFEAYVRRRKNNTKDFQNEYYNLPQPDMSQCTVATSEDNLPRNRYKNIYAYDAGRVLLHPTEPDDTDYINANYITGYKKSKEYIATQGPRKNTLVEFWRMIWQEKANRIVMVANKMENGKSRCGDYWAEEAGGSLRFSNFIVTTEAVEKCADYITSVLSLRNGKEVMTVRHFHFTTWEDKGNPVYGILSLLAFYRKVHSFDSLSRGPMVVHCSAGVGRTGTFIAMDILMQQATVDRCIDVSSCVQRARRERMNMVQTLDQYYFLHDALVEFIKSGDTSLPCIGFEGSYQALCAKSGGLSSLELQFQKLCQCRKQNTQQPKDGSLPEHINKNRRKSVIPANSDRPFLHGKQEDSYINAVFVDGYKHHDFYIATQLPLPHGVVDFWRLVHSQESSMIITLHPVAEQDQYWPNEGPKRAYGAIEVALVETERVTKNIVSRTYNIAKKAKQPSVSVVKHLQLLSWPDDCELPPQPSHLLELRDQVLKWQQQNGLNKTTGNTIVQCLDGVGHCGLYLAAVYVLEKMQLEQEIDPFFAVRFALRKRPEFIESLAQYQYLFKMAREQVTEHNEYANV